MHHPVPVAPSLPEGLSVERCDSRTILSIRWRNMASWALLPLGMVAAAIPVSLFLLLKDMPWNDPIQLLVVVFGVVGLVFAYIVVRRLVNVTRLEVTPKRIRISHGPVPWRRPVEVTMETIQRVEVRTYTWHHEGRALRHYHVWSVHADGSESCLLERDTDAEQATHVREEIQRVLEAGAGNRGQAAKI